MGLFSKISDRIFGRKPASAPAAPAKPAAVIFTGSENDPKVSPPARNPAPAAVPAAPAEPVDVEAVAATASASTSGVRASDGDAALAARVDVLEAEVAALREALDTLLARASG